MTFQAALIVAAGRRIAVVAVRPSVFSDTSEEEEIRVIAMRTFGIEHVVLMNLDENNVPTFMGSREEVDLLADSDFTQFPWKEYQSLQE